MLSQQGSICLALEAALCGGSPIAAGLVQLLTHDPGRCLSLVVVLIISDGSLTEKLKLSPCRLTNSVIQGPSKDAMRWLLCGLSHGIPALVGLLHSQGHEPLL